MTDNLIFDDEAAELLIKEARRRKKNADQAGVSAYLSEERPRLRADTKFLSNVIHRLGPRNDGFGQKEHHASSTRRRDESRPLLRDQRDSGDNRSSSRKKREQREVDDDDRSRHKSRRTEGKDDEGMNRSDRHRRHRHHHHRHRHGTHSDNATKYKRESTEQALEDSKSRKSYDYSEGRLSGSSRATKSKEKEEQMSSRPRDRKQLSSSSSSGEEELLGPMPAARGRGQTTAFGASIIDEHFKEDYEPANDLTAT